MRPSSIHQPSENWGEIYIIWICRKCRTSSFQNHWNDRGFRLPGQSSTNCLYNIGTSIFSLLALYMTDYFCETGIIRDLSTLPWQFSEVNFPAFCLTSLDNILSAIEARAFSSHENFLAPYEANSVINEVLWYSSSPLKWDEGTSSSRLVSLSKIF